MRFLVFVLACLFTVPAFAFKLEGSNSPTDPFVINCKPTPMLISRKFEKNALEYNSSNNLRQPPGAYYPLKGQPLLVTGRVVDASCTPVENAKVEMFQPDPTGYYHDKEANSPFPGAAHAVTDNLGFFTMLSVYPGARGAAAPRLHFRIAHRDYKTFQTTMYFAGDARNAKDAALKKVPVELAPRLLADTQRETIPGAGEGMVASFNISIPGTHEFRQY